MGVVMTEPIVPLEHQDTDHQAVTENREVCPIDQPASYDDVHSLALCLCEHEGLTFGNALRLAAADLDFMLLFPREPSAVGHAVVEVV